MGRGGRYRLRQRTLKKKIPFRKKEIAETLQNKFGRQNLADNHKRHGQAMRQHRTRGAEERSPEGVFEASIVLANSIPSPFRDGVLQHSEKEKKEAAFF